jgi:hypothetical protein
VLLMARSYANVATAMWRDDDFIVLAVDEQYVYFLLISQPDISAAGVLSIALTRWASRSKGMSRDRMLAAVHGLQAHRFVVADFDTDELLVRSFVRWDGGYTNSKRRFAIRDAADQIVSPAIRSALAAEFERLDLPLEWIPTFSQVDSLSIGHTGIQEGLSENPGWPTPENSDIRRVVVTKAKGVVSATHNPQPTTLVPSRSADPPASGRKRATRIADDFTVTAEMVEWAREHTPGVDGRYETAKFIDYWRAKSGKDATKLDWIGTWRNWMRKASERAGPSPVHRTSTTDQRVADALSIGQRLQAQADRKALES